jgi:hypothetical protein
MIGQPARKADFWDRPSHLYVAIAVVFPYYSLLITNGTFDFFGADQRDLVSGLVFNSMLAHLLEGDFGVDADAVRLEAFVREGRTYTYFGIAPAFLRLPLLVFSDFRLIDITALSIVIATCVAAYFKCASLFLIRTIASERSVRENVYGVMLIFILVGGAQVQFLKASVYQEVICWGMAIGSAFVYCSLKGLLLKSGFTPRLLATMALLAGTALLTRVTTGVGLYLALVLLLVCLAFRAWSKERRAGLWSYAFSANAVMPFFALISFLLLCGFVNYQRWGNPFVVAPLHLKLLMASDGIAVVDRHGEFNLLRLLYSALYYFLPITLLRGSDGTFLFSDFRRSYYDGVELPPSSFLITDAPALFLAAVFFRNFTRAQREGALDIPQTMAILSGLCVTAFLMLAYFYLAFRFRGEFYAPLEFAAFLGAYVLCTQPHAAGHRTKLLSALGYCAIIGIVGSHAVLFAHKVSPFGNAERFLASGWVDSYSDTMRTWRASSQDIW